MVPNKISLFLQEIAEEVAQGFRITPLVGAGISVASGIPAIAQLSQYLEFCIVQSLIERHGIERTRYRNGIWPLQSALWDPERKKKAELFKKSMGDDDVSQIRQEAFGAMADWRSSLQFLSRLDARNGEIERTSADSFVTDSFFLGLVSDAMPNLSHRVLAHLADPLHSRLLLTTNFDELLEKAFSETGSPITSFDVHLDAGLPDARTVSSQRSLIKLHGGRYGLRANYSLDSIPSQDDQRAFTSYFSTKHFEPDEWLEAKTYPENTQAHLLVLGSSAKDSRTRAFIVTAMARLPGMKVFWICNSPSSVATVEKEFASVLHRFNILQHSNLGLLLLQMYQHLTNSLPPSGIDYPAIWQLPLDNVRRPDPDVSKQRPLFEKTVSSIVASLKNDATRIAIVESPLTVDGGSSTAAAAFNLLQTRANCVWLDLDDFSDSEELFTWLTTHLAQRTGQRELLPVPLDSKTASIRGEAERYCGQSSSPWYIFLDARSGTGANVASDNTKPFPNDTWLPKDNESFWKSLEQLTSPGTNSDLSMGSELSDVRIKVLVARYCGSGTLECEALNSLIRKRGISRIQIRHNCIAFDRLKICDAVMSELETPTRTTSDPCFAVYVFALLASRRLRYATLVRHELPEALSSVFEPFEGVSDNCIASWIDVLTQHGLLASRQGGFIGIDRVVRERLRSQLRDSSTFRDTLKSLEPQLETILADWYQRLFFSSNDPFAAFESIFHRCNAARLNLDTSEGQTVAALSEAVNTLHSANRRMLARGQATLVTRYVQQIESVVKLLRDRHGVRTDAVTAVLERLLKKCSDTKLAVALAAADFDNVVNVIKARASVRSDSRPKDLAQLCLGIRAYKYADEMISQRLSDLGFPSLEEGTLSSVATKSNAWAVSRTEADANVTLREVIDLLRRLMHLKVLRAQSSFYAFGRSGLRESQKRAICACVFRAGTAAVEVMRLCDSDTAIDQQRDKYVFASHLAMAAAMLGRFNEASRRIVEARVHLSSDAKPLFSIAPAVVDLHAAEVGLISIAQTSWFQAIRPLLWRSHGGFDVEGMRLLCESGVEGDWISERRKIESQLDEVRNFVSRAKKLLNGHRRSVSWWTKLYELELKQSEFRILCLCISSAIKQGEVVVSSVSKAQADVAEVMADAGRIISVDVFQCARILESGTNHLKLLLAMQEFGSLAREPETSEEEFSASFSRLRIQCTFLLDLLVASAKRRLKSTDRWARSLSIEPEMLELAEEALLYVEHVRKRAQSFLEATGPANNS